jgi:Fe-S cluster biosynthesis and repair protein YggX
MTRLIHCSKLNKEAEGLDYAPYPGELGKKIFDQISKEAWQMWITHQTMLINEYRLSMLELSAREYLAKEMANFLFGDGSEKPSGYVPPEK